jgi:hypothetical protein
MLTTLKGDEFSERLKLGVHKFHDHRTLRRNADLLTHKIVELLLACLDFVSRQSYSRLYHS